MSGIIQKNKELDKINETEISKIADFWLSLTGINLSEVQIKEIPLYLSKFGFDNLIEAMRIACDRYVIFNNGTGSLVQSVKEAFVKVRIILEINRKAVSDPYLKPLLYILAVLRKRLMYINEKNALEMIRSALELGISKESLVKIVRQHSNWMAFQQEVLCLIQQKQKTNIFLDACEMKVMLCIAETRIGLVGELLYQDILNELGHLGLRKVVVDVGLEGLLRKGLIACENPYGYSLTNVGRDWLVENQALLL